MRRMFVVLLLALGLLVGTAGSVHAGKSCPNGSRFVGGKAGGICIDLDTDEIVKRIRN